MPEPSKGLSIFLGKQSQVKIGIGQASIKLVHMQIESLLRLIESPLLHK
jgi:hypothetical protein